jgi:FkbM family methyltransferase
MDSIKRLVRGIAARYGIVVMKYPISPFSKAPIFDLSVRYLMAVQGTDLRFIQVGANDGVFGDPLRKFILEYPWRGVLIEPQPHTFAKLCSNYDAIKGRLIFENLAIAANTGVITMYRARNMKANSQAWEASVSSLNRKVVGKQLGSGQDGLEAFSVPCATLDDLVERHHMDQIDILQIDAEGYDYQVLKTLDLRKTPPRIVQLEHGHLSPADIERTVQYLGSNGYRILYGGHQMDTLALHRSYPLPAE